MLARWVALIVLALLALLLAGPTAANAQPPLPSSGAHAPLQLRDGQQSLNAWPAATLLWDASQRLSVQQVVDRLASFEPPPHLRASLGVRQEALWMRIPLVSATSTTNHWLVNIHYPILNELDIYLVRNGQVMQHAVLGNLRLREPTALHGRTPAMGLTLDAGVHYDVLIRVRTGGPMILPVTVSEAPHLLPQALREQMLQGLLNGLAFCLLVYSLIQWVGQRDRLFAYYALLVTGSAGFSLQFFGVGAQFLWTDNLWVEAHAAIIASLLALAGSFLFLGHALTNNQPRELYLRAMKVGSAVSLAICALYVLDAISTRTATTLVSLITPLPTLLSVPAAVRRVRQKDPVGITLMVAWSVYCLASAVMVGLVQGWVPLTFWTLHSFQIGSTLDMLLFLRVLGLRAKAMRTAAQEAVRERDTMRSLAHSDPLTGLPNRRGLQLALEGALARCTPDRMVAVYLMDLNGFKPVNDTYGHDVGDNLLVAVGKRLQGHVRHDTDLVARLGGDEFIVMAQDIGRPGQAEDLGRKLLQGFDEPFALQAHQVRVGLSMGYAIAPLDGLDAKALIQKADAAMYAGKQGGKNRLSRYQSPTEEKECL